MNVCVPMCFGGESVDFDCEGQQNVPGVGVLVSPQRWTITYENGSQIMADSGQQIVPSGFEFINGLINPMGIRLLNASLSVSNSMLQCFIGSFTGGGFMAVSSPVTLMVAGEVNINLLVKCVPYWDSPE